MRHSVENVAINDVLPLKAARRDSGDTIANLKCFWGLGPQRPNFSGYIYTQYASPPYSARISAIYFLPFGNVWLGSVSACNAWELSTMQNLRRVGENSEPILSRLRAKVHEISRLYEAPCTFQRPFPILSRFFQKIFAIKSRSRRKTEQMQIFLPQFLWEGQLRLFYGSLLGDLLPIRPTWQSLVEFRLLMSVCEAWQ